MAIWVVGCGVGRGHSRQREQLGQKGSWRMCARSVQETLERPGG